jgi:hypothetical protein
MASADVDMFFDDRNTARPTRGRFHYQDQCIALRCVANLVSEEVTAVVVEWSTDYIALLADGEPELVSVKHREPGQGDWPMGGLGKALRDLHRVWREMDERCRCAFASNAAPSTEAMRELPQKLGGYIDAGSAELERFRRIMALPDPPLPRRTEIEAVGVRNMAGVLSLLDRDPGYAEQCYLKLVERIAAISTEELDDSPEERAAQLTDPCVRSVIAGVRVWMTRRCKSPTFASSCCRSSAHACEPFQARSVPRLPHDVSPPVKPRSRRCGSSWLIRSR